MSVANLHETLLFYTMRKNELNLEITELSAQKTLASRSQSDAQYLLSSQKHEIRDYYKALYEGDSELQAQYKDYTEIPDFEDEIDKIVAENQERLDELTAWETAIDTQITTDDAERKEIEAYMESFKGMLQNNISDDFSY